MNRKSTIITLSAIASVLLLYDAYSLLLSPQRSPLAILLLVLVACFALPVWITVLLRTARQRQWLWFASSIVFVEIAPIVTFLYGLIAIE